MHNFGLKQKVTTPMFYDSQNDIAIASNLISHSRTKHIEVHYHYMRERLQAGDISLTILPNYR